MLASSGRVAAPHLVDLEVVAGLRRLVGQSAVTSRGAHRALREFEELTLLRFPVTRLLDRIWQLRETLTPYDASYVALAETLNLSLVTTDLRLGRSHGHRAQVITFSA
jgi:predicted nucleic acid-binding protein